MATNIEQLRKKRGVVKGQLTRLETFYDQKKDSATVFEIESRLTAMKLCLQDFREYQTALEDQDAEEFERNERADFEEKYLTLEAALRALKEERRANQDQMNSTFMHANQSFTLDIPNMDLPRFTVPKFTGDYNEWPSFLNQFDTLVHDCRQLSGTRKMSLLLEACDKEKVRPIIATLPLSDANYTKAREILIARFSQKRLIFETGIRKFFNLPTATNTSSLRSLADSAKAQLEALQLTATPTQISDGILVELMVHKLDKKSLGKWEEYSAGKEELLSWTDFMTFLEKRCISLECQEYNSLRNEPNVSKPPSRRNFSATTNEVKGCILCKKNCESLKVCPVFLDYTPHKRSTFARKHQICMKCLANEHNEEHFHECEEECPHCGRNHHELLHYGRVGATNDNQSTNHLQIRKEKIVSDKMEKSYTFLGTAIMKVRAADGTYVQIRALFDGGAQSNFITKKCAAMLGLPQEKTHLEVSGVHGDSKLLNRMVELQFKSNKSEFSGKFWAVVNPFFNEKQPTTFVNIEKWEHIQNIPLADENFNVPQDIDILLNAQLAYGWQLSKQIKKIGFPLLQETLLGWIVVGNTNPNCTSPSNRNNSVMVRQPSEEPLMKMLEKFWEIEELPYPEKPWSQEEQYTVDHFFKTVQRDPNGRVRVRLPFKKNPENLGDSYGIALKRFYALETQLRRNPELSPLLKDFMQEYVKLGHCTKLERIETLACFIPYFYVLNWESTSTKLRVVFDASCNTETGESLNNILAKGPVLQDTLFMHMVRFQLWPIAIGADICKMYRQVALHEDDQKWQCILYREKPSEKVQIFKLNTVTYGLVPSSYQAVQAMHFLADKYAPTYPVGAAEIKSRFYMDNFMSGAWTVKEANQIREEVKAILEKGCMQICKWCSNSQLVLENIPKDEQGKTINLGDKEVIKTLGYHWIPETDQVVYNYKMPTGPITPRTVISEVARIYDPLGKLQPVLVRLKLFMQQVTANMKHVDEPLQLDDQEMWQRIREELQEINKLTLPRYVVKYLEPQSMQIHGFADASTKAMAAAIYLRMTNECGEIAVHLLCAKSKVAPLKKRTLPRLELCGALLLAKLYDQVKESVAKVVKIPIEDTYLWSDATIVCHWISKSPHKYVPFVGVRTAEIQRLTEGAWWRHVPTEMNVADPASRGQRPKEFLENKEWIEGPEFLYSNPKSWPNKDLSNVEEIPEELAPKIQFMATTVSDSISNAKLFGWNDMRRKFGYVAKFLRLTDKKKKLAINKYSDAPFEPGTLDPEELNTGIKIAVKIIQRRRYSEMIWALENNEKQRKHHALMKYNPFIDPQGLLRIGGRLSHADWPYEAKYPLVLPENHWITTSLFVHTHFTNLHAGGKALLGFVRQKFWPEKGKWIARKTVHKCLRCRWIAPKEFEQMMGDLPKQRLAKTNTGFLFSGMDLGGPFWIKQKGRGSMRLKAYICIFVCLTSKAVHIEVVEDLSTQAFINALIRFVSRRGCPQEIWSDNATNFVGARNKFQEVINLFKSHEHQRKVKDYCAVNLGVRFKNIPAKSPNFGGIWESAIKIAKYHLVRCLGDAVLELSELQTVTTMVEAQLNTRPLIPVANDPKDDLPLTPWHLLTGGPLIQLPEPVVPEKNQKYASQYERVIGLKQQIFNKFRTEYWHDLNARYKWEGSHENAKVGQRVLIKDNTIPSLRWPWGTIKSVSTGSDGKVRAVVVENKYGTYSRGIRELCPLPFEED